MIKRSIFIILALALSLPSAIAGGKRPQKNRISFHIQGGMQDGPRMVFPAMVRGKRLFFQKTPIATAKNITSFKHFENPTGTFGATFSFDRQISKRITAFTTQHQKKWLVAMLNGRVVDSVIIDKPIRDGKLVVWDGIKLVEIVRFEYAFPLTGESREEWRKRLKEHNQNRKAAQKELKERAEYRRKMKGR